MLKSSLSCKDPPAKRDKCLETGMMNDKTVETGTRKKTVFSVFLFMQFTFYQV